MGEWLKYGEKQKEFRTVYRENSSIGEAFKIFGPADLASSTKFILSRV